MSTTPAQAPKTQGPKPEGKKPQTQKRKPQHARNKTKTATAVVPVQKSIFAKLMGFASGLFKTNPAAASGPKQSGTVKFFSRSKGFGFIQDEKGTEIFVHISGLKSRVRENDKVTFQTAQGKRGLTAVNVTVSK